MRTFFWTMIILQCLFMGLATDAGYAATISAKLTLLQYDGEKTTVPITLTLLRGGVIKRSYTVFLDSSNRFTVSIVASGLYDVRIKAPHWLSALRANVNVNGDIDLGTLSLTNGDVDGDNKVTWADLSILGLALGSTPGSSNWDFTADLDDDGEITSTDLSILGLSLGKVGESVETTEYVYIPVVPFGNAVPIMNVSETYTTTSTSSQGHTIEYSFNWGDGTSSPWSASASASHAWSSLGTKTITVTARCQAHTSINATSAGLAVNVGGIEMMYIPAGSFLMGNSNILDDAYYGNSDEFPQHSVALSAYYIGKYEVTRGEYRQFMNAGGYTNSAYWSTAGWSWQVGIGFTEPYYWSANQDWGSGMFTQTDNYPVVGVTYYEAEAFCKWAGGHLPTEAQWERAARWDMSTNHPNVYPWGDVWDAQRCNNVYDSLYPGKKTAPVGSYGSYPSSSGCQDMAGNVWEWCQDWYKSYPGSSNPFDDTNSLRVLRGGGWLTTKQYGTRCAFRSISRPYGCYSDVGFRLAR